jgi:hypothetical protein
MAEKKGRQPRLGPLSLELRVPQDPCVAGYDRPVTFLAEAANPDLVRRVSGELVLQMDNRMTISL